MNIHDPWRQLLPWYVNGTLSPDEQAEVEQHLAGCMECQRAVAAWRAIARVANTSVPAVPVAHSLDDALTRLHRRLETPQAIVTLPNGKDPAYMSPTPAQPDNAPAPRSRRRTPLIAAISVALIAVLAFAGFALLRPHTPQSNAAHAPTATTSIAATSTSVPTPTATPFVCKHIPDNGPSDGGATDKGITLHVDHAYADASLVTLNYHITSSVAPNSQFYPDQGSLEPFLSDAQGHTYGLLQSVGGLDAPYFMGFAALPPAQLSGSQPLTLVVKTMFQTCNNQLINGTWQVRFTVTPLVPHTVSFQIAPVTHSGISVQPISLETFSGQVPTSLNNTGSGARLILRFSGLTSAEMALVASFDTRGPSSGSTSGAKMTLNGVKPAFTQIIAGSQTGDSEEIGFLYVTPQNLSGTTANLAIDRILISAQGQGGFANGPWNFDLPLH